jgi:hypothetical protein
LVSAATEPFCPFVSWLVCPILVTLPLVVWLLINLFYTFNIPNDPTSTTHGL